MKDYMQMESQKVMEYINGITEQYIKANLRMELDMAMVNGAMANKNMKAIT